MFRKSCDKDVRKTRRDDTRPIKNILVTGGCGFIGANFINSFIKSNPSVNIYNLDKLDYCSNINSVENDIQNSPQYHLIIGDICDKSLVMRIMTVNDIDTVLHFAAATLVDNSFIQPLDFTFNNVTGTHILLECARLFDKIEKFIYVSTDEVYGESEVPCSEEFTPLKPTTPYASSKAAAEFIARSYLISFGLPIIITRGTNVYGPYQYMEKVIPKFTAQAWMGQKLTIQGDGHYRRRFVHVSDATDAFELILKKGVIGEIYNIGSNEEYSVLELARSIVEEVFGAHAVLKEHIEYVPDRLFNDSRYLLDSSKLRELGWRERVPFAKGLVKAIHWYIDFAFPTKFWKEWCFYSTAVITTTETVMANRQLPEVQEEINYVEEHTNKETKNKI